MPKLEGRGLQPAGVQPGAAPSVVRVVAPALVLVVVQLVVLEHVGQQVPVVSPAVAQQHSSSWVL